MRKILALYMLWVSSFSGVRAQDTGEPGFIHYTRQQGLSNNFVSGIVQDSAGYIWIGTHRGLNRFDGTWFKTILYTGSPGALPDNAINSLQWLPGQQLGVATSDGAQIISTRTLATQTLNVPTEDALRYWSNSAKFIQRDADGNYGVSTNTGFYIFSPEGQLIKRLDGYSVKDIGHAWMLFGRQLYLLPNGNMLQESRNGLFQYNRRSHTMEDAAALYPGLQQVCPFIENIGGRLFMIQGDCLLFTNPQQNSLDVLDIHTGRRNSYPACFNIEAEINWRTKLCRINDTLWALNARKGFYLLHIDPRSHCIICDSKKYFADCSCNIVFADKQQRLWIGTNNGLFMQDLQRKLIDASPIAAGNMIDSSININSLFITGNAILAGAWGRGMLVIGKQGGGTPYIAKTCLRAHGLSHIYAGLQQSPDTLWLGTDSGLVWLHTRNYSCGRVGTQGIEELSGQPHVIYHFFKDRQGDTWMSSNQLNRIFCYHSATHRFEIIGGRVQDSLLRVNAVEGFTEDKKGNIWISGDAIARWNPHKRAIDTLIERLPSQRNRKKGYKVVSDARGDTWILITGDGIVKMTGPDAPMHLREKDLSWDYDITRYPSVHQDAVFVSSDNNIGILDTRTYKGITLGPADGLPDRIISSWFFGYDASDSSTWFACGNQLCRIPGSVFVNDQLPPAFAINELDINNDSVMAYPGPAVTLNHEQNNLRVSFGAINYTDVPNMRYYYRLLNTGDTAWATTTSQQVQFNHLNPGIYRLQLKVAALNSQWPAQVKEMTIRIRRPYWSTAWFISVAGLLSLLIIYDIYKRKIRSIKRTERGRARMQELEAGLAEAQLSALQTQMNPHFIFNALNSIKRMILDSDTRQASRYLSKFALMIRLTLDHSKTTFVTLRESIEYLQAYLEMEQLRFDDSFSYIIRTDGDMDDEEIVIPTLMMQPLAENAIWHGLMTKEGNKTLRIGFVQQGHRIACTIEDNGVGVRQSELMKAQYKPMHRSVGIGNLQHRIRIMNEKYATDCTLEITDLQDIDPAKTGTLAVLTFNKITR